MGQLSTEHAKATARTALQFLAAFDGEDFGILREDMPGPHDRRHLAIALDHVQELAAMVLNMADRVPVAGNGTEYGWLVENGKQGDELRYRTWRDGLPEWTADHNEATRYCRRIDAERAHREDEDAWRIVQHAWDNIPETAALATDRAPDGRTYIRGHTAGCNCQECTAPNAD